MKAIVYSDYGGPEVLREVDLETPAPADHELLVKVRAASVNPADWHLMRGTPFPIRMGSGFRKPKSIRRLGLDYSGTVEAVGRGVTQFTVGNAVFGGHLGSLAEYVTVAADRTVMKPETLTFEQAAAVPVAGVTALQALRDKARIQRGQTLLINGASGGVGTFAVQLAKVFGAAVTGVQSTRNLELIRSLGADHVIDYTRQDFTTSGERYDVILDNVGNRSLPDIRRVLKGDGTYLPNGGGSPDRTVLGQLLSLFVIKPFISQKIRFFVANPNRGDLQILADLMQTGAMSPVIDSCYPFSRTADAMRHLESGHARGKVVVTVGQQAS